MELETKAWRRPLLLAALVVFSIAAIAREPWLPSRPSAGDYYRDSASLLDGDARAQVNQLGAALKRDQDIPMVVLTVSSLADYGYADQGIERFAQYAFDSWGIGSQQRNYGILVVVSPGDRQSRIELGRGFAHRYDGESQQIMDGVMVPAFRGGNFDDGILDGLRALDAMARGLPPSVRASSVKFFDRKLSDPVVIFIIVIVLVVLMNMFSGRGRRSGYADNYTRDRCDYWYHDHDRGLFGGSRGYSDSSGGGFSGGGGSSGGGSSGGGGATGSW